MYWQFEDNFAVYDKQKDRWIEPPRTEKMRPDRLTPFRGYLADFSKFCRRDEIWR
jgi:hypothetical protein